MSEAKKLRHPHDMLVQNQVFIYPHLTKAEAMAAYEQRCQRRLRNKRPVHVPAAEATGIQNDSSVSLAGATASMVMQSTGTEDLSEVLIPVPSSSDTAHVHHGNVSSTANLQPVSSGYSGTSLATGHSDLPKVQKQSSN